MWHAMSFFFFLVQGMPCPLMKCQINVDQVKIGQNDQICKGAKSKGAKIVVFVHRGQNHNFLKVKGKKCILA